jgi:transcription elongation factor Elf1
MRFAKFQCPFCGDRKFTYSLLSDMKKGAHGAVCFGCGRPVTVANFQRLTLVKK